MNQIEDRIANFQKLMKKHKIDAYIVPTADYHQSEYVGDYFKEREFLTGFTGSAGTAVVTKNSAYLWTDGRYFLQAATQLKGTGVQLMKMGEPEVPTIEEFLKAELKENEVLGFDGRTIGEQEGEQFAEIVEEKNGNIVYEYDLLGELWSNRPEMSKKPAFLLPLNYAGESVESKLTRVRKVMKEHKATMQILASLDDIDWMLNIRGDDVEYSPLLLSYAIVKMDEVELYVDAEKLDEELKKHLQDNHVKVYAYDFIYQRVKEISENETVMVDPRQVNYALFNNIPKEVKVVKEENPIILMKAVKNDIEVENIRNAHIKDGVAHTKYMYWLKKHVGKEKITEISASDKLAAFRAEQEGYLWPSFGPISAYKEHGAIVHYSATEETDVELRPEGLLLSDTGGNYWEGSTDITRTIALGEVSAEEKRHFTTVAISMLKLAGTTFLYGCTGMNLDCIAREPFWRQHLNYNHGTGHGVGYLANIHEEPQRFQWKFNQDNNHPLEEHMVITDEPGLYIEGSHGVRIENELLVKKDVSNEYGQFMKFEILTFVPIDLDAIDATIMTTEEKELLNAYHKDVYSIVSPYLNDEEKEWLKLYTREV